MNTTTSRIRLGIISSAVMATLTLGAMGRAYGADNVTEADKTVRAYKKTDPGLVPFFEKAVGYAVFSRVGKGGIGVGGAFGRGVLFEKGKATGKVSLTQLTVGLQLGGQAYSEIIFFETEKALTEFKGSNFALSAQVSAVALKSGASANAKYRDGVAVFTATKGGLMVEGSLGGQKFNYEPFADKT
jgi:lipid-binding SYLF domain-containing protein